MALTSMHTQTLTQYQGLEVMLLLLGETSIPCTVTCKTQKGALPKVTQALCNTTDEPSPRFQLCHRHVLFNKFTAKQNY